MRSSISRFDAFTRRRYRVVLFIWLFIAVAAVPFALNQSRHLTASGFSVPDSQSAKADAVLGREYPAAGSAIVAVLLWPGKRATPQALSDAITRVQKTVRHLPGVTLPRQVRNLAAFAAELDEPVVLPLKVAISEDQARNMVTILGNRLGVGGPPRSGVAIHLLGESALWAGLEETAKNQLTRAEIIGFPILLVVLITIFGSLWAAFMPVTIAVVALIMTGAAIYFLSLVLSLSLFTIDAASMLGIGVAIDYSLIVLARVRQELHSSNIDDARRVALSTSGVAVVVSGLTCIAALAGVFFIPIGALRSMAVGAAIIIAVSVLAAITLLPAFITLLGRQKVSANLLAYRRAKKSLIVRKLWTWDRMVGVVTNHPRIALVMVGGVLVTLCIPALSMRTNTGVLQQLDPHNETRVGFTEVAQLAGPGILGPTSVVLHSVSASSRSLNREVIHLRTIAQSIPNVRRLGTTEISHNARYATFTVIPSVNPESVSAERLVQQLRTSLTRALVGTKIVDYVGGASASQLDEVQSIRSSLWKVLLAVLVISLAPMTILLRSAILPFKAVIMNLLSVGAAYGILVVVFQWGWLDGLLDYHAPRHVDTLVPPLLLAIVFGLSTDYEVFLLSRIRERWLQSGNAQRAVVDGLTASGKTITGAAAIIVCVFAVFVGTGVPIIKEVGLGSAFAIGIDATLIRLILMPAVMTLLGNWSWWTPRWVHRVPHRAVGGKPRASENIG